MYFDLIRLQIHEVIYFYLLNCRKGQDIATSVEDGANQCVDVSLSDEMLAMLYSMAIMRWESFYIFQKLNLELMTYWKACLRCLCKLTSVL